MYVHTHRRLIHGLNIMYFLFMVFLLCQSHTKALRTLNFFDHKVGVTPLVPPEYAVDCRVHTPNHPSGSNYANIMDALHSDIFLLAHFLGPCRCCCLYVCGVCVCHCVCDNPNPLRWAPLASAPQCRLGRESIVLARLDAAVGDVHLVGSGGVHVSTHVAELPRVLVRAWNPLSLPSVLCCDAHQPVNGWGFLIGVGAVQVGPLDTGCCVVQLWRHGVWHGRVQVLLECVAPVC